MATNRSIGTYSFNDEDSNVDLAALDSDSSLNDHYTSASSSSDSSSAYSSSSASNINNNYIENQNTHPKLIKNHSNKSQKLVKNINVSTTNTSKHTQIPNNNFVKLVSNASIPTKELTQNSAAYTTTDTSYVTGSISNPISSSNQKTNSYNDNSYYYNEEADIDNDQDIYQDIDQDDTYTFEFETNANLKTGDKLKTTWSLPIQNEKQYKDLQIIDEVSKLQNLNFFSQDYVENLENLKISQLGLLIDMVKLNENSFDEFYNIWDEFDLEKSNNITSNESIKNKIISSISSQVGTSSDIQQSEIITNDESSTNRNIQNDNDDVNNNNNNNDVNENKNNDNNKINDEKNSVTWFDINNSESFKLMNKRKNEILNDLGKINNSIDQIDAFTKSMWTQL